MNILDWFDFKQTCNNSYTYIFCARMPHCGLCLLDLVLSTLDNILLDATNRKKMIRDYCLLVFPITPVLQALLMQLAEKIFLCKHLEQHLKLTC